MGRAGPWKLQVSLVTLPGVPLQGPSAGSSSRHYLQGPPSEPTCMIHLQGSLYKVCLQSPPAELTCRAHFL